MNKLIIWDWNGTLLNDVDACINSMNMMLSKRGMSLLNEKKYKEIFTFPVQEYYKALGFNFSKESFEELSVEYIDLYKRNSESSPLHVGVKDILQFFKSKQYSQVILSASEQKALEIQVKQRNIYHHFDSLIGLDNILAKSKLDNAKNFISNSKTKFEYILFVGDTYHDLEVAKEINAECILVRHGHQDLRTDKINGNALLVDTLMDVNNLI